MSTWIIEPRDPLIVRDGRPFGPDPGVRAASLAFPFPSTTTGGARNRFGLSAEGTFDPGQIEAVKGLAVRGPLLVELADDGGLRWYAPAPADALLVDDVHRGHVRVLPIGPLNLPPAVRGGLEDDLLPVGRAVRVRAKPARYAPQFWRWDAFATWLAQPAERICAPAELGLAALPRDTRTHVSISDEGLTAAEGALFQTSGLSFVDSERRRLGLAIDAAEPFPHFVGGLAPLAGERRLVTWRPSDADFPACPAPVRDAIIRDGACRVVLLTPAFFASGSRPAPLLAPAHGVTPRLRASCGGRPQVVSGWDLERRQPKPTRRLAPAGSVYFLTLEGDAAARAAWVDSRWMACVSDVDDGFSASRDGFGLLALGAWDGQIEQLGGADAQG